MLKLRIFISSPSDVGAERSVALAVTERLQFQFRGQIELETYLWERSLLRATATFQTQIVDIQQSDLALFILWARMGTPLPLEQFSRPDGSQYRSGTEYEFERAREGYEKGKRPEILCYQKNAEVRLSIRDRQFRAEQIAGVDAIGHFVDRWFRNADGTYKAAFYSFERTAQFEDLLETHLSNWIRERLKTVEAAENTRPQWKGSPFRGLESFDFEHALIYCGRTTLVSDLLDTLRRRGAAGRGLVMVTGMSGVGKSSLVKAGLLPLLTRPYVIEHAIAWRRVIFKPNIGEQNLLTSFAAALLDQFALPELANETTGLESLLIDPSAFTAALNRVLDGATQQARDNSPDPDPDSANVARLIVVCDQFEAIFDETVTLEERSDFCEALRTMILTGRVWVVGTLRADFFSRCSELPEKFRDLFIDGGVFTAGGPRPAELAQMIRRPAVMAGLKFERRDDPEEGLDEVLRDAASGNPTVLPLLEFTLSELWRRSAGSGVLRFSDYESLGGLQGALKLRAEEEFGRLSIAVQASLRKVLAALVHIDPTDERLILQNRAPLAQFSQPPEKTLVDAFVAAHLLVGDNGSNGTPVVGLAHEALLREWPPAVAWIEQNREMLRLRAGITGAAGLWRNDNDDSTRLLTGRPLKDAVKLLDQNADVLTREERSFVDLSLAEDRLRRRRLVWQSGLAAVAIALAILIPTIGLKQISYGMSLVRELPAVWRADRSIPISPLATANLNSSINSLARYLSAEVAEGANKAELTAWPLAQISVALYKLDPALANAGKELRELANKTRDEKCLCWKETDDKLPHTMATAWVFYALAHYDQPAEREEIALLLGRQQPEGWWSMFPATPEGKNASTSATAYTVLALHKQLERKLISVEQEPKVREAVRKATGWLVNRAVPGEARWTEYPPDATFEREEEFLAVSALVVHVAQTVDGSQQFDAPWLNDLPAAVPAPGQNETSKAYVFRTKSQITLDDVRHYRYPWMLRATVDCYAAGNIWQRVRALLWIEEALKRAPTPDDLRKEIWTSAEILFSLRHVQSVLARTQNQQTTSFVRTD